MSNNCYFASGENTDSSGSTYIPCNTTAVELGGHSACCAPNDMCFTNGLCKANTVDQYNWNWRVGCTDPTFSDPACPSYCQGIGSDNGAHLIFQCSDDETWCCSTGNVDNFVRNYNFTCCSRDDLTLSLGPAVFYGRATIDIPISTLEASSTTTTSASTSSSIGTTSTVQASPSTLNAASLTAQSTTASPSATNESEDSTSSTKSMAIGMGVGIPLGLILMAIIGFLSFRLGRRQNRQPLVQQQSELPGYSDRSSSLPAVVDTDHSVGTRNNEALLSVLEDDRGHEAEMAHHRSPVELDGKRMSQLYR